jgi:hypothetical protein
VGRQLLAALEFLQGQAFESREQFLMLGVCFE